MRNIYPVLILAALAISGCRQKTAPAKPESAQVISKSKKAESGLSQAELWYIRQYKYWRRALTDHLNLPSNVKAEEMRPYVAHALGLDTGATWADILSVPTVRKHLTDKRLKTLRQAFKLPADTTWLGVKDHAELLISKN